MARRAGSAAQRYHDRVAGRYDAMYEDAYWAWHDSLTWDHIKPLLPRNLRSRVVDLGCGTGKWSLRLIKSGYHVMCVDISGAMLEQARRKIGRAGGLHLAEFVQADLCDLSALPAEHFSLAVALGEPVGCAKSPARALKQIRRCLVPAGTVVATFDNRWAGIDYYVQSADTASLARFVRTGRTHWLTRDRKERFEIHTYSPGQVRELVSAAGFEVIDLIGKTVLPLRQRPELLADPPARRRWTAIERRLWRDPAAMGRCSHLQVVARKTL